MAEAKGAGAGARAAPASRAPSAAQSSRRVASITIASTPNTSSEPVRSA
jgi:hypothetical protein